MRHLRYIWHYIICQRKHRSHHGDVQWELMRMGLTERKMGDGTLAPATPHLWRVWTRCDKCGLGWTHTVWQAVDGTQSLNRNDPLPQVEDATFRHPQGRNPRKESNEGY